MQLLYVNMSVIMALFCAECSAVFVCVCGYVCMYVCMYAYVYVLARARITHLWQCHLLVFIDQSLIRVAVLTAVSSGCAPAQ